MVYMVWFLSVVPSVPQPANNHTAPSDIRTN